MTSPTKRHARLAAESAKLWLVLAIDRLVATLKAPDDVACAFEIAFSDGYQTGAAQAARDAEVLVEALRFAQRLMKSPSSISAESNEVIEQALAEYCGGEDAV